MRDFAREEDTRAAAAATESENIVNVNVECENLWEIFQKLLDFVYAAATELMVWF